MKILAVDTATPSCGVAIIDGERVCASASINPGHTHSRSVMPLLDMVLNVAGLCIDEIDVFAVTIGPGSFTGLRIGIACIKGLALALGKPVCGISALQALAAPFSHAAVPVCPMIDARKNEVYYALYGNRSDRPVEILPPRVAPVDKVVSEIDGPALFVGTGALAAKDAILKAKGRSALFVSSASAMINPAVVAELARDRIQEHGPDPVDTLCPLYIRPPDAIRMKEKP